MKSHERKTMENQVGKKREEENKKSQSNFRRHVQKDPPRLTHYLYINNKWC